MVIMNFGLPRSKLAPSWSSVCRQFKSSFVFCSHRLLHPVVVGIIIDNLELEGASIIPHQPLSCIPNVFDPTVAKMKIGFKYFFCPGAFVQYRDIPGAFGKILGMWSVLMQVTHIDDS